MFRKILILSVAAFLVLFCSSAVFAEGFDPGRTGSISVTLLARSDGEPIVGAQLSVYHAATVSASEDGRLLYRLTEAFEDSGIDLKDPDLVSKLETFVAAQNVKSLSLVTDSQGTACSGELALGLYLVRQTNEVEGFAPCTSFLVTVPAMDADEYVYHVNATPKTEVEKRISVTVKKEWNTDDSTAIADSVTVQLLRDGKVVETAELSARNRWQTTYEDMPESDSYSIQEINVPAGFTATYSRKGNEFTVTNTASLPQTGQLVWPIPVLVTTGFLMMAVGFLLLRKKEGSK